ncbi:MAG: hypothetical protein EHM12_11715 [Dehalococcoidia bacterium]|nr:MAG: hypothetical protein EHM12_11715 [Dehalococcoidia bacterium]
MFEVTNEKGVEYLFNLYHEELGFEEMVSFNRFPDITAIRNGKKVKIELEYNLFTFLKHYHVDSFFNIWVEWLKIGDFWCICDRRTHEHVYENRKYEDKNNLYEVKYPYLCYKTLKDKVDIVIYWKKSHGFKIDDDIEFIDLGKLLIEKNLCERYTP